MSLYSDYLAQIEARKTQGLHPKPIEDAELVEALIEQILDAGHEHREGSLQFFIFNTLPGTTSAAGVKAAFLKRIILGEVSVPEISRDFAFELLSHMKGGPSVEVLLDLALGDELDIAAQAAAVLKTQVFLYEADTDRLAAAHEAGNALATDILQSYVEAEFFTKLPPVDETIQVVTYVTAVGDVSTDLLSPGSDAHSRSDRELHGQSLFEHNAEKQGVLKALKAAHPDKRVMLVAEKGTMGVGSSRMSGVNNVALWTGIPSSPYVPFINIAPIVGGTNGISPIFLTTVGVTGGIGIDLKNWVKQLDAKGQLIVDDEGEPVLKQLFSIDTGTVLTINTKTKQLLNEDSSEVLCDISSALTPQKLEFIRAGGSYAVVFGKKLQTTAAAILGVEAPAVYAASKEISHEGQGMTAVEKIFNKNAVGTTPGKTLHAGSDVRVKVNIVGSQDTTGLMTSQELEMMAATVISPDSRRLLPVRLPHGLGVGTPRPSRNIPKLMKLHEQAFGLITGRDPKARLQAHDRRDPQGAQRHHRRRLVGHHRRRLPHPHVQGRGLRRRLGHGRPCAGDRRGDHAHSRVREGDLQGLPQGPHGLPRRGPRHPGADAQGSSRATTSSRGGSSRCTSAPSSPTRPSPSRTGPPR